jgi:hypothetical protein
MWLSEKAVGDLRLAKEEGQVNILVQPRLAPTSNASTVTDHAPTRQPTFSTPDGFVIWSC